MRFKTQQLLVTCTAAMLVEDQRFIHEDLERLEQGISDRVSEDPRNVSSSYPWARAYPVLRKQTC
jgi:hypothetical protein